MYKKLVNFIKNNMGSNTEQLSLRIPRGLQRLIKKKTKTLRMPIPDYIRAIVVNDILPEILEFELKKVTCEWITKQGKDSIEIHFDEKIKILKEIIAMASYAIEETEKLQEKFIDAEVEYMNNINSKIN